MKLDKYWIIVVFAFIFTALFTTNINAYEQIGENNTKLNYNLVSNTPICSDNCELVISFSVDKDYKITSLKGFRQKVINKYGIDLKHLVNNYQVDVKKNDGIWIENFNPVGYTLKTNNTYYLKIKGSKSPFMDLDVIPEIVNVSLYQFAWWNSTYNYSQTISIFNRDTDSTMYSGKTVNFTMDTRAGITNVSLANGNDIRVVWGSTDCTELCTFNEIDRINITPFNDEHTIIRFRTQSNIFQNSTDNNYTVFYHNLSAIGEPPNNESNIYVVNTTDIFTSGQGTWTFADSSVAIGTYPPSKVVDNLWSADTDAWISNVSATPHHIGFNFTGWERIAKLSVRIKTDYNTPTALVSQIAVNGSNPLNWTNVTYDTSLDLEPAWQNFTVWENTKWVRILKDVGWGDDRLDIDEIYVFRQYQHHITPHPLVTLSDEIYQAYVPPTTTVPPVEAEQTEIIFDEMLTFFVGIILLLVIVWLLFDKLKTLPKSVFGILGLLIFGYMLEDDMFNLEDYTTGENLLLVGLLILIILAVINRGKK